MHLLYLPLFNAVYLFFLFFLSLPLNIYVSFIFIALFLNWYLALVLFSTLCFSYFCSDRYNFWFPLLTRSIYCTLFLLECFDFAYGCIYIYVYIQSHFYGCYQPLSVCGLLQFCEESVFFSFFLSSFIFFPLLYNFNFLKTYYFFYIYSFVCLSYCSFLLAVNL